MGRVLGTVLRSFMRRGTLRLTTSHGKILEFGDGTGTPVAVRFTTRAAELAVLLDPELAVGECYMNGTLVIEQGSIADFLALAFSQDRSGKPPRWTSQDSAAAAAFNGPSAWLAVRKSRSGSERECGLSSAAWASRAPL